MFFFGAILGIVIGCLITLSIQTPKINKYKKNILELKRENFKLKGKVSRYEKRPIKVTKNE